MRIRIRFEKEGTLRFIGHLDTMRYFQKAFQRAQVAVCFSEGFHPHPILSFAAPLGVGLTSKGEYMDLTVEECGTSREMIERLNAVMAEGIRVTGFRRLPDEERKHHNAMATVGMADYEVRLRDPAVLPEKSRQQQVADFLARPAIPIRKKTKKKEIETDIRPLIFAFSYCPESEAFTMRISAGSKDNLRPEHVMSALLGLECTRRDLEICRLDMLTAEGISLGEIGEEIV